jgi:hypothetical protein
MPTKKTKASQLPSYFLPFLLLSRFDQLTEELAFDI